MPISQEQLQNLQQAAQQIGQNQIALGAGSPLAQATGSPTGGNDIWGSTGGYGNLSSTSEAAQKARKHLLEQHRNRRSTQTIRRWNADPDQAAYEQAVGRGDTIDTWYERARKESEEATQRYNDLSTQLSDLSAKKNSQDNGSLFGSVMASARGEGVSDETLDKYDTALKQAQVQLEKTEAEMKAATRYKTDQDNKNKMNERLAQNGYDYGRVYDESKATVQQLKQQKEAVDALIRSAKTNLFLNPETGEYEQYKGDISKYREELDSRSEMLARLLKEAEDFESYAGSHLSKALNGEKRLEEYGEELAKQMPPDNRSEARKAVENFIGVNSSLASGEKTDWRKLFKGIAYKGADAFSTGVAGGLNFFFGDAAEEIHTLGVQTINDIISGINDLTGSNIDYVDNKGNYLTRWYESLKEGKAQNLEYFKDNANTTAAAQIVDRFGTDFVAAVPMAIEAMMTAPYTAAKAAAGAGSAALSYISALNSTKGAAQVGTMFSHSMQKMLENPQFWTSYIHAIGNSYEDAKEDGLNETDASIYTLLNGFFNAAIEVGGADETLGGIQNLPGRAQDALKSGKKYALVEWFKDAVLGEAKEEVEQGVFERGLKAPVNGAPIVSTNPNDDKAIFNPWSSGREALSGGMIGGLLGGGQTIAANAASQARQAVANRNAAKNTKQTAQTAAQAATPAQSQAQTQPQNLLYNAMQSASRPAPVQTAQEAAGAQEAPTSEIAQLQAQEAAQTVKPVESEAAAPTPQQKPSAERYREIQSRIDEINRQLDNAADEAEIERLSQEGEALYQEARQLESQPEVIQDQRVQNGEVSKGFGTAENHIDNRTAESVSKPSVKAFQFDHPELHQYFVDVARELITDVEYAEWLTKAHMYELGSAIESGPIRELMDQGLTKPEIIKALQDIIANNGQENYAKAKRVERVLSQMMTDGWLDLKRQTHDAVPDYIAAKDAINGAFKSDSWEKYLTDHELVLSLGEVTEDELRAEWEQMHPQEEAAAVTEPETATATVQPVEAESAGEEQSAGTIPASEQTTAERTNGQGPERERNMAANLRQNEKAEPALRQDFDENRELYTQLTNAEVTQKAEAILAEGYEAARNAVQQAVGQAKAGMKLAPEMAVAGYHVATEMAKRGDIAAARELCSDIAAELTYSGQLSQIGRLIIAADPSIRISTVEKLVKKLNDGMSNRQKAKNVKQGKGTESGNITVSDEALQRYAEAETEEAQNEALDAIEQEIADQIPATFRDKFTALRYLNMLGNLKTQARNIVGNTAMMAATNVKYLTQHVGELAASLVTGGKYQGNTALNTNKELRQQAADDFAAHVDEIKGDAKYSDVGREAAKGVQDKRTIFGAKTGNSLYDNTVGRVGKGLEAARKATNWAMDVGDEIFLRQVYVRSFAGWMKAHGVTDVNSASAEQVSAAREFAKKEAQEATFHDSNKVSDWVSGLGRGPNTPNLVKMISEGVAPFRKTPANVAVRAVEYSPVGAIGTIYEAIQAKKGNASAADVINSAAKNLTGTALFGIGMLMAAAGRARASGDEEDKELTAFQKMGGAMDYSVKVGDKNISLSQLAPMAIPFFMGVKLKELLEYNDNLFSADSIGDLLGVVSDPMLEMSMLSGVNDLLNDISSLNGDTDALPSLVANAALSYMTQGLTNTLLGQLEQASEKNRQTTYTDTKSADATGFDRLLGKKQYQVSKATAKIPGVDYHQQDYVDAWGRTQSNGGAGERAFNALLNPTYTSRDRSTKVDAELERLHAENRDKEGFPDVFPKNRSRSALIGDGVVMTPDEYLEYEKAAGQKKLDLVSQFMDSSEYKGLTDEQRADVISNLYSFADNLALRSTRESYGIRKENDTYKLLSGTDKPGDAYDIPALQEKNAGEYIAFDTLYKGAVKSGDYSTIDNLLYRYSKLNGNTKAVVDAKKPTDLANLLKFRDSGASAKDYYAIKDSIGEEQWNMDASSSTGSHVRLAGLGSADIPDSKKDKLVESGAFKLSSAAKDTYGILRNAGLKPEQISEWFENADWFAKGAGEEAKADGSLNAYEVAVAISKMSGLDDSQREALYQQFKSALQNPSSPYDTWKSYNYRQTLGRSGNYGRTVGRESAPKSGNVLYDYYAERQRTG